MRSNFWSSIVILQVMIDSLLIESNQRHTIHALTMKIVNLCELDSILLCANKQQCRWNDSLLEIVSSIWRSETELVFIISNTKNAATTCQKYFVINFCHFKQYKEACAPWSWKFSLGYFNSCYFYSEHSYNFK